MDRQGHKHADGDRLIDGKSLGRTAAGRWLRAGRSGGWGGAADRFGRLFLSTWHLNKSALSRRALAPWFA